MKRLLLTFCLLAIVGLSFAQQRHRYYCQVSSTDILYTSIQFSFGATLHKQLWGKQKFVFVDENGKKVSYSTLIDAANIMAERGWTLQQSYAYTDQTKFVTEVWIFYKDVEDIEELKEGMMTSEEYKSKDK